MFFTITNIGGLKYKEIGMVEVSANFYLEPQDEGYDAYIKEHYVTVPIFEKPYEGKVDELGIPADQKDYDNWYNSLPTVQQLNPFCNHSIQFESNVTPEEIDYCMKLALEMTAQNYLKGDLQCLADGVVVNQDIHYVSRCAYYEGIKQIPPALQTAKMQTDLAKVIDAGVKATYLKTVDFDLEK